MKEVYIALSFPEVGQGKFKLSVYFTILISNEKEQRKKREREKQEATYIFTKEFQSDAMCHVHGKHEAVSLEERATHILIHQLLELVTERPDAHLRATPILKANKDENLNNVSKHNLPA